MWIYRLFKNERKSLRHVWTVDVKEEDTVHNVHDVAAGRTVKVVCQDEVLQTVLDNAAMSDHQDSRIGNVDIENYLFGWYSLNYIVNFKCKVICCILWRSLQTNVQDYIN